MTTSGVFRVPALLALAVGAFGIGSTEFVIMGLLQQLATDLQVNLQAAGFLISAYALGVVIGAPLFTWLSGRMSDKTTLLVMMLIFTLGNLLCWWAPTYTILVFARILSAFAHGTFFGVGSVVATRLVAATQQSSAIAFMFSGLTLATILGVPAGAWLGQNFGWRVPFAVISLVGVVALIAIHCLLPDIRRNADTEQAGFSIHALFRPSILLKLLTTILAFASYFVVFTYIQTLLVHSSGFSLDAVSAVLLAMGAGIVAGNTLGGRLSDRRPQSASLITLLLLLAVFAGLPLVLHQPWLSAIGCTLMGAAAFATVAFADEHT